MRKRSFVVRGAQCLQALMALALFAHCGGSKRDFGGIGGSGGASAGAAGRVNGASGSSHAGTAGRATAGTAAGGLAEAAASGVGDSAGDAGTSGSLGGAGGASGGSSDNGGTSGSGGNSSAGMGGSPPSVGSPCATGSDCPAGNCADGVCCEGPCTGCNACSTTLTGKANGTCAPVVDGQDPHNQCADETTTNQCGNDGMCNGNGACRKVGSSKVCAAAACGTSGFTPARTCDGAGACKTAAAENCGSYPCTLTGCAKTCTAQADCSGSNYCNTTSGTCTSKKTNGTAATQTFECSSGIVADSVCCDQACTGCKACSGAPMTGGAAGQCLNVVAGQDAHNTCAPSGKACGLDGACDGTGACRSTPLPGAACSDDPTNKCVTGGTCQAGACAGASTPPCAAPAKCKGPGTCVPATGLCSWPDLSGTSCDDGNACTTPDQCTAGVCGGTPKTCNAPPPCKVSTSATCSAGNCSYPTNATTGVTDSSCPATAPGKICNAGACVRCTTDAHCAPSTVTPSCNTSQTCVCRIQDPNNLILNPNFDGNLNNWTVVSSSSTPLQTDVDACPQSNSVYVNGGNLEQCINRVKENTTYYLGAMSKQGSPGDYLRATFFNQINCGGSFFDNPIEVYFAWGSSGWAPTDKANDSGVSPAGAKSAYITSYSSVRGIDQVYFGTVDHY